VTHPFHPLCGKSFELLSCRQTWGEDRVFFYVGGELRALPAIWTDVVEPPVFVSLAAGRAHFRPDDLLSLVELIGQLKPSGGPSASKPRSKPTARPTVSGKFRRKRKEKDAANPKRKRQPLVAQSTIYQHIITRSPGLGDRRTP
jgi:hypothetical protein